MVRPYTHTTGQMARITDVRSQGVSHLPSCRKSRSWRGCSRGRGSGCRGRHSRCIAQGCRQGAGGGGGAGTPLGGGVGTCRPLDAEGETACLSVLGLRLLGGVVFFSLSRLLDYLAPAICFICGRDRGGTGTPEGGGKVRVGTGKG